MTLSDFIKQLQELESDGYGELPVFYRHGSSGDCGELSSAHVTNTTDECGPFDLDGTYYVSIYAGH